MKWTVTTAPTDTPVSINSLITHLKLPIVDDAVRDSLVELLEEAVSDAEMHLEMSLMPRTITAVYYADDENASEKFELPRGPILSITSVTDDDGVAITDYDLESFGTGDYLVVNEGFAFPLTVVYRAGFTNAAAIDPAIKQAIKVVAATNYFYRTSHSERSVNPVHNIERFYQLRGRGRTVA